MFYLIQANKLASLSSFESLQGPKYAIYAIKNTDLQMLLLSQKTPKVISCLKCFQSICNSRWTPEFLKDTINDIWDEFALEIGDENMVE